jgi:Zn-finger nucleic acid-binding protein
MEREEQEMQCPVCKKPSMGPVDLEPDLHASECSSCSGTWIARSSYDAWRSKNPVDLPENPVTATIGVADVPKAKICPLCGHLLLKYQVGHGLQLSIDYCTACGGIWLDKGEWKAIKAKNLHDNLHQIVSLQWQTDVRRKEVHESIEQAYVKHLGKEAYEKAKDTRAWLRQQSQKALILAYLAEKTPDGK